MFRSLLFAILAAAAFAATALPQSRRSAAPWRNNVNLPGGDFRTIDMNTGDPTACRAACERDPRCRAWTLVKPDDSGRSYCWLKDSVPEAVREDCCISGLKGEGTQGVPTSSGTSPGSQRPWRNNVNLPGGDFRTIDMNTGDPTACRAACERDPRCRAWTLVKPDENGRSYCWLKDSVPEAVREDCCISGLKGESTQGVPTSSGTSPGSQRPWRNNVNLPGGDFRTIDMNTGDPTACRAACERDPRCRAWTLVKPDDSGRSYCWLKDSIPEAMRDNCCISAIKGEGGSADRERPRRWPSVVR